MKKCHYVLYNKLKYSSQKTVWLCFLLYRRNTYQNKYIWTQLQKLMHHILFSCTALGLFWLKTQMAPDWVSPAKIKVLVPLHHSCLFHSVVTFALRRSCQTHCSLHGRRLSPGICTTQSGGPTGARPPCTTFWPGTSCLRSNKKEDMFCKSDFLIGSTASQK